MHRLIELVRRGAKTSIPLDGVSTAIQNLGPSAVNRSRSMNSAAEAVVEKTYMNRHDLQLTALVVILFKIYETEAPWTRSVKREVH